MAPESTTIPLAAERLPLTRKVPLCTVQASDCEKVPVTVQVELPTLLKVEKAFILLGRTDQVEIKGPTAHASQLKCVGPGAEDLAIDDKARPKREGVRTGTKIDGCASATGNCSGIEDGGIAAKTDTAGT